MNILSTMDVAKAAIHLSDFSTPKAPACSTQYQKHTPVTHRARKYATNLQSQNQLHANTDSTMLMQLLVPLLWFNKVRYFC